jgi:hypothetical protein
MARRLGVAFAVLVGLAGQAAAEVPRGVVVRTPPDPNVSPAVSSNVIFIDRCAANCSILAGSDDSRTDHSSIGSGLLQAFSCGDAAWAQFKTCMNDVFSPFNVVITDVDPGTASHLEIKVAGMPQDIGLGTGIGGIAHQTCSTYQANTLVFAFANVYGCTQMDELCATAAQEIAHTWGLDHVTNAADPMTYFGYNGRRYYADNNSCGSDCQDASGNYCKPGQTGCTDNYLGIACTAAQTHRCACGTSSTQNDAATVLALFGAGNPTPPTVTITKPKNGDAVSPGFVVAADITSPYGVTGADMTVDGMASGTTTTAPYVFNAPASLAPGAHTVVVTGHDVHNVKGSAMITAIIGNPCTKPADCPTTMDTCIGGRCVPGPGTQGGLGSPCTAGTQCADGTCASDGTNMYCTDPCMKGQCPSGFGCLPTGSGSGTDGVCWPNYNDGSGGGGCATRDGAPASLALVWLGYVLSRRRRRA